MWANAWRRVRSELLAMALLASVLAVALATGGVERAAADSAPNTITTIAGSGVAGGGGDCDVVRFSSPVGVDHDAQGNLYVADWGNHRVRRVTPDGQVTTVAGTGSLGFSGDGGPATAARLGAPNGVAVAADGDLYIADSNNRRIRHVDAATGVITTVAGTGTAGDAGDGGPASAAQLSSPFGVVLDDDGHLYVSDSVTDRVRRISATTGVITTVAGTGVAGYSGDGGAATAATLDAPLAITLDDAGNLFVADSANFAVRRVDATTGVITTVAGTGAIGFNGDGIPATTAQLRTVTGLAVDAAGHLYLADSNSQRIRRVDAVTGLISTVVGTGSLGNGNDDVLATSTTVNVPNGLSLSPVTGDLWFADKGNHRIRRLEGTTVRAVAGDPAAVAGFGDCVAATNAELDFPMGVAYDGTIVPDLYIAEVQGHRVRRLESDSGTLSLFAGTGTPGFSGDGGPATAAQLNQPSGIVTDGNDIYVADSANHRIRKIDRLTGTITTVAGTGVAGTTGDGGPASAAQLNWPSGLARDPLGNLYVTEYDGAVVRRIDGTTGTISTIAGTGVPGFSGDGGPATAAQFDGPIAVAVAVEYLDPHAGPETAVYVADEQNDRVRRVGGDGTITTVAGSGSGGGYSGDNGPATAAELNEPSGLVVDADTNDLFVLDGGNSVVRRVTLGGEITTVAGTGSAGFSGDGGPATAAQLHRPFGIALHDDGDLVVADSVNHRVRRITAGTPVGTLRVTTSPALPAEIVVDGISRDSWGLNWVEFPIGAHEVCFGGVSGWARPPCQDVVVEAGQTTEVTGTYTERGYLQVTTSPAVPSTILVNGIPRNDWGMWMDFAPGDYSVCFSKVAGWDPPPCQVATVTAGATTVVAGSFVADPGATDPGIPYGNLRVTTDPPVASRILVDGVARDAWGLNWVKLPPGPHEVCFGEVLHTTAPPCHTVEVVEGATTVWTGSFAPKGFLQVSTSPAVPATIFVDGEPTNAWGMWNALPPGQYEVCYGAVPGLAAPPCETATVEEYATTALVGVYASP
jgi:sugar lactone lactonase YvrE